MRAASTLRGGGVSTEPYASLNLAQHVGDEPAAVSANRVLLRKALDLPSEPAWLEQVHGTLALPATDASPGCKADASWTDKAGSVCVVMTADCLPVLFCDDDGLCVAAAHAGWRGLAEGVLQSTIAQLPAAPQKLMAWLGPAIGPNAFEVGPEVRARFLEQDAALDSAFTASPRAGHYMADLYALARAILHRVGIERVSGGDRCTHTEAEHFFSFRRDARCGRMASLVWLQD